MLCKSIVNIDDMGFPVTKEYIEQTFSNPDNDPRGPWTVTDLSANHKGPYFAIENPNTSEIHYPPKGRYWVFNEKEVQKRIADGRIIFGKTGNGKPVQKVFAANRKFGKIRAESWWDNRGMNSDATAEMGSLFNQPKIFTHPKPSILIYNLIKIATNSEDIILDFFSGSASAAHAVMKLNSEDGGNRKYIMVQLPETCDEKSEAYKAGYKNICEVGKERIRRAGQRIQHEIELAAPAERAEKETGNAVFLETEETIAYGKAEAAKLDVGFRVLKLDSTNMKDVYYNPHDVQMSILDQLESNIKEDRTPEDLLFQVMLDLGVLLSSKIEESTIAGKKVFNVADNFLIACFDEDVSDETITAVAKLQPAYFVMRDSSMKSDSVATNFDQIFATYSPDTVRKVI